MYKKPQQNTSKTPNQQNPTKQFHIVVCFFFLNPGNNSTPGYVALIQNLLFLE